MGLKQFLELFLLILLHSFDGLGVLLRNIPLLAQITEIRVQVTEQIMLKCSNCNTSVQ